MMMMGTKESMEIHKKGPCIVLLIVVGTVDTAIQCTKFPFEERERESMCV
jgi:hypothetical protein